MHSLSITIANMTKIRPATSKGNRVAYNVVAMIRRMSTPKVNFLAKGFKKIRIQSFGTKNLMKRKNVISCVNDLFLLYLIQSMFDGVKNSYN